MSKLFRSQYGFIIIPPYECKPRIHCVDFADEVSLTKQSMKDECDINSIMAKYKEVGLIEFQNSMQPMYADLTGFDFREAQDLIVSANNMFDNLPSHIRKRFNNDPAEFVEFYTNEANDEESVRMGLKAAPEASGGESKIPTSASVEGASGAPIGAPEGGTL